VPNGKRPPNAHDRPAVYLMPEHTCTHAHTYTYTHMGVNETGLSKTVRKRTLIRPPRVRIIL
jgi:hypothetical protein